MSIVNSKNHPLKSLTFVNKRTASFHLYEEGHVDRSKAECAVKKIFRSAYGADITSYLPCLLTAEVNQRIAAVVGVRCAAAQSLFLEQYLSTPIEKAVNQINGLEIQREQIVEIGNLVSCKTGVSRQLFIVLAFALAKAEIEWVSFTATAQVEQLLAKLSLFPVVVGQANEQAIVNGEDSWGSYYVDCPNVCVGNVFNAVHELKKSMVIREMVIQLKPTIDLLAKQIRQTTVKLTGVKL
jgi:hypothetical protein